jgi:hypothetical protein
VRTVAIFAGAVAIALAAAVAAAAPPSRLLAIVSGSSLAWVDGTTLTPLPGPTLALPRKAAGGYLSPDRSIYLLGSNGEPKITFVDVGRMQLAGSLTVARSGSAYPIAWPTQDRVFVETWACCPTPHVQIVVVDPERHAVLKRVPLAGGGLLVGRSADGVVTLVERTNGIKPVRAVVIDHDGATRSAPVARIKAGTAWRGTGSNRRATIRQPGLAVDRAGGVAYVVDPSGLVARLDLRTLAVSYHARGARRLAHATKEVDGPMVSAAWAGDGKIVVSGTNAKLQKTAGGWRQTWDPAGIALLDTGTWASRMLDSRAAGFTVAAGTILVPRDGTLTAYSTDGTVRYRTPIPGGNAYASVFGDYAYVSTEARLTIVDVRSGAVVATVANPALYLVPESELGSE